MSDLEAAEPDAIVVLTTMSSEDEARDLAAQLIARRLAACVQIGGPIESTYRWQGQIETAAEWRITIKTRRTRYADVAAAIRELHSYDTPQIVAIPITAGDPAYLKWLYAEVSAAHGAGAG